MTKRNLFHSALFALLLLVGASSCSQQPKELDIIPMPRSVEYHRGTFTLSPETKFYASLSPESKQALARYLEGTALGQVAFADEATGNLDTRTSFEILVLFQKLYAQGRTIIFVTHNPDIAAYSSRNIVLRDGKIRSDTQNDNILSAAQSLAALPPSRDD